MAEKRIRSRGDDLVVRPSRREVFKVKDLAGLGDQYGNEYDPLQQRDVIPSGQLGPVANAEVLETAPPPALTPAEGKKTDEQIKRIVEALHQTTIFSRRPNWLDPPLSAKTVDIYTNPVIVIPPAVTNFLILHYIVPSGAIAILTKIGNDLENAAAFFQVTWRMRFKGEVTYPTTKWYTGPGPLPGIERYTYRDWKRSLGDPSCPCCLPMPLILQGQGEFILEADNADIVQHIVDARIQGWEYTVEFTDTDTDISAEFLL